VDAGVLDSTNRNAILRGRLFPYHPSVMLYRCPSDRSKTDGVPRVRSYAINGWMGGRPLAGEDGYRVFLKESDLVGLAPADALVFIDEHEESINDGWFAIDMEGIRGLLDAPANRHDAGYTRSFADGHTDWRKLTDERTRNWRTLPISNDPLNADWQRLSASASVLR
jgi:hypothetical protein